jgi:hypothetical protein
MVSQKITNYEITKLRNYKITRLRDYKITRLRNVLSIQIHRNTEGVLNLVIL